jgi:hypothetical protein
MSFNGNEGAVITLAEAATLTEAYRNANSNDPNLILGHFIGINKLNQILSQIGCVGIRTYHGLDVNGKKAIVMVGVDSDENDLTAGVILDKAHDCPSNCGSSNSLNT